MTDWAKLGVWALCLVFSFAAWTALASMVLS